MYRCISFINIPHADILQNYTDFQKRNDYECSNFITFYLHDIILIKLQGGKISTSFSNGVIFLDFFAIHVTNTDDSVIMAPHSIHPVLTFIETKGKILLCWHHQNENLVLAMKNSSEWFGFVWMVFVLVFSKSQILIRNYGPFITLREIFRRCKYSLPVSVACSCIKSCRNAAAYVSICIHLSRS